MLDTTTPGVVNIATRGSVAVRSNPLFDDPFFRQFFDRPQRPQQRRKTNSLGSGVIVDAERGYIITNSHVIKNAEEIIVTLRDGRQLDAALIGADADSDVAVIQVKADDLTEVAWGDSDRLRVGDFVVAIGNPFGLGHSVTSGIVSGLGRSGLGIEVYEDFIQTDASINPGNSGGALVDLRGHLIGINTAIYGANGGNIGIGFAIPAVMAKQIMEQLIEHGEVSRGRLGVGIQNLDPQLAKAFGLEKQKKGAVITLVEKGTPADAADLRPGDIVISVNGRKVNNASDMRNYVGLQRVGQALEMEIIREGETKKITANIAAPKVSNVNGKSLHPRLAGATLSDADSDDDGRKIEGLLVVDVAAFSAAAESGLRKGDVITSINRKAVKSISEARRLAQRSKRALVLNIQRGDSAQFLVLR